MRTESEGLKARLESVFSLLRRTEATTAIEFALIAPIVTALLFGILQVATIFLAKAYLETTAEKSARYLMTNQGNNLTQAQFASVVCGYSTALFNCANFIIQLQQAPPNANQVASALPKFDATGQLLNPTSYGLVAAPNKAMLTVMYEWPVFAGPLGEVFNSFTNGTLLMSSTQIFQVEPVATP